MSSDDRLLEQQDRAREAKLWVRQNQKPGAFPELPPLLEARRLEHGIPDGAFEQDATFGRVLLWQVPLNAGDTFVKDGKILMTENRKDKERDSAPRGIIVTAGLSALDYLRSNGMDLGHIISFVRLSPYELQCDTVARGIPQHLKVIQVGDIIASVDLKQALRTGEARVVCEDGIHKYKDKDGNVWRPQDPRLEPDY